jgi:tetratricopeptide (TPR) repeat protein
MPRQKSTHVDSPEAVGRRLKTARERAGLSQRKLSFAGCSPAYISRIESGDRIPSLQLLRELGRRLGTTEDYLATGSESRAGAQAELTEAEVALRLDELDLAERLYDEALRGSASNDTTAAALAGLGQIAFRRGDPREAIARLEAAAELHSRDAPNLPSLEDSLGRAYAMVGELESAIAVFNRGLDVAEEHGDVTEIVRFSVLLAYAFIDSGNLGRAEEHLGRALAVGKNSANPNVRIHLYWSQAKLHGEKHESEIAAHYARRALEVLRLTEDTHRLARAHQLLAHIELDRRQPRAALEHLEKGWPLLEQTGNPVELAHFRIEEARALAQLGRTEEAAALAMELTGKLGNALPEDAARAYTLLADVFADLGDSARAQELYELSAEILGQKNPNRYLAEVYGKLAELAEADGRKDEAYELMKKALGLQRAVAEKLRS